MRQRHEQGLKKRAGTVSDSSYSLLKAEHEVLVQPAQDGISTPLYLLLFLMRSAQRYPAG